MEIQIKLTIALEIVKIFMTMVLYAATYQKNTHISQSCSLLLEWQSVAVLPHLLP